MEGKMRNIKIEKVILHCSTAEPGKLERCIKLLKFISGMQPVKTLSRKRIPAFKIRPGLEIGCKVTIRKKKAIEVLTKLFTGIVSLKENQFSNGFLSFGIKEYIEISSLPYQREIGILGFEVVVNLTRVGRRVSKRRLKKSTIGSKQKITKKETIEFMKNKFNLNIEE
jgi:large subunit ribosomal protein L5